MLQQLMSGAVLSVFLSTASVAADRTLVHEAVIAAPVAEVWDAFTTAEGFTSWAVPLAEIDLRVGGAIRSNYNPNGTIGDAGTIVNEILAFEPQRMISLRNVKAPDGFPNAELFSKTWSVIYFSPVDDLRDRTHIRLVGMGYGEGGAWDDLYTFFKAGNAQVLDALRKKFEPNGTADDPQKVMTLLGKLAGGEWIHEGSPPGAPEGTVFRVRNVIELGPDGKSLIMRGWIGGKDGLAPHSGCLVWLQPGESGGPGEVRFRNVDEMGGVVAGSIRLIGCDSVEWDWNRTAPDGQKDRYRVTMSFVAADAYGMKIDQIDADGAMTPMVQADFKRVEKTPAEFMTIRAPAQAKDNSSH
jgi:uncharacterized protein YndB with AHSA1/START domain